jgi:hypothetical protein
VSPAPSNFSGTSMPFHPLAGDLRVEIERHAIIVGDDLAHSRPGAFLRQEVVHAVFELMPIFATPTWTFPICCE